MEMTPHLRILTRRRLRSKVRSRAWTIGELGRTGLEVSRIGLGCGNFGGVGSAPELFGQGETEEEAFALMDAAWAAGITFFDTAASYGGGRSERWVGRWRRERGVPVLLSSKVYWSVTGDPEDRGLSR